MMLHKWTYSLFVILFTYSAIAIGSNTDIITDDPDNVDMIYDIRIDQFEKNDEIDWGGNFIVEEDVFTRDAQPASHSEYVYGASFLEWSKGNQWDFRVAARFDGNFQYGKKSVENSDLKFDYGDSYIRYRENDYRLTLGAQTIRWGRVDNLGPLDNMATLDFSRGVLSRWGENYRSSLALRSEIFLQKGKLDLVYLPVFRPAELADEDNVWFPINFRTGRVLGLPSNPAMAELVKNASIDDDISGERGFGIRFSSMYESIDYGITLQRVRLSAPYYSLSDVSRQELSNNPPDANTHVRKESHTLQEEHPRNWIVGADAALDWQAVTWRIEAAWFSDLPATTTNLQYKNYHGVRWAGGMEFFPGDADTRVNLQLSGHHLIEQEAIIDLNNIILLSGELETLFSNNRWKLSGRFNLGLSDKDIYITPELSFLGWEPLELYLAYHYLDGDEQTIGGFYKNNDMFSLGIRGMF